MIRCLSRRAAIVTALGALALPRHAAATTPLRLILPVSADSLTGRIARLLAAEAAGPLGRAVMLRSVTGQDGGAAADAVARAAPDGATLLLSPVAPLLGPLRQPQRGAIHRLAPLLPIAATPLVVVASDLPLLSLAIAARLHRDSITWGTTGPGSAAYVAMLAMEEQVAGSFRPVVLPGRPALLAALERGRVAVTAAPAALVADAVRAGRISVLVVAAPSRLPLLPETASAPESAITGGLNVGETLALFAPRTLPAAVQAGVTAAFAAARAAPAFVAGLEALGSLPASGEAGAVTALADAERSRWSGMVDRFTLR